MVVGAAVECCQQRTECRFLLTVNAAILNMHTQTAATPPVVKAVSIMNKR
jgi:hypothetical protein